MVGEIFENLKINQKNLQFDSIRKELESLAHLDASSNEKLAETLRELHVILSNIDDVEDPKLVEEYAKVGNILSKAIIELKNEYDRCEEKDLKLRIYKALSILEKDYKFLDVCQRTVLLKRMIARISQTTDVIEQFEIATNIYALSTDMVKKFWNIFDRNHYQIMMGLTYPALEVITNKNFYDSEDANQFRNSSGKLIIPVFRETLKEFVKTVLSAQEEIADKSLWSKSGEVLLPEQGESIENQIEIYQHEEVNELIVSESVETENEKLKENFDFRRGLSDYPNWNREAQIQKNQVAMEWAKARLEEIESKQKNK